MSTTIYLLEPEATPPPPRSVNISLRSRLLLFCGAILFTAVIFGGAMAVVEAIEMGWLSTAGTPLTARITNVETPASPASTSSGGHYAITYTYDQVVPGRALPQTGVIRFDVPAPPGASNAPGRSPAAQPVPKYRAGDILHFRYAMIAGRPIAQPWSSPPYRNISLLIAMGATLMLVGGVFLVRLSGWHRRRISLLRDGMAITGNIVKKRFDNLEGKCYVAYSYRAHSDPVIREREEQCTPNQWKRFEEGDAVTVLYDPKQPATVGLYRLLADP